MSDEDAEYVRRMRVDDYLLRLRTAVIKDKPSNLSVFVENYARQKIQEQTAGDEDEDAVDQPDAKRSAAKYVRTRRKAIVQQVQTNLDGKEIEVIEKSEESKAKIAEITKTNFLFSKLDQSQRDVIVGAMFEVRRKKGDIIIKQGDEGDNFYVMDKGEVDVLIAFEKGKEPTKVGHMSDGQGFGELALMHNQPRAATILATTDCVLWAIDRNTYRQVMMSTVMKKRAKYQDLISKVPFLDTLTKYERHSLCDALQPMEFPKETNVVIQGEIGSRFFIIEEGEVAIWRAVGGDPPKEVGHLHPPQFFGEVALLSSAKKRTATVKTIGACKFLTLEHQAFTRLLGPLESILKRNMEHYEEMMKK